MTTSLESLLPWAQHQFGGGAKVVDTRGLREGSNPWLVRLDHNGRVLEVVLKVADLDRLDDFTTEIAALRLAEQHRLPAPRIIAVDAEGSAAGAPVVLETLLRGHSRIPAETTPARLRALGAIAASMWAIEAQPSRRLPLRTRPISASDFATDRRTGAEPTTPLLKAADDVIRALPVPDGRLGLAHGDLWQGNILWEDDAVSGIVDWDMAGVAHHGVDLSSVRLDAVLMFGSEAAGPVLAGWRERSGRLAENLPYWDAVAALNQPGDMAGFIPAMHDQGRTDLDAETLNQRRDSFLRSALDLL